MIYDEEIDDIDRYDRADMWIGFFTGIVVGFATGLLVGFI